MLNKTLNELFCKLCGNKFDNTYNTIDLPLDIQYKQIISFYRCKAKCDPNFSEYVVCFSNNFKEYETWVYRSNGISMEVKNSFIMNSCTINIHQKGKYSTTKFFEFTIPIDKFKNYVILS